MSQSLDGVPVFVAVAEEQGFRAAGKRLGVTGSAVSHSLRRLEERLGVTLVQRTTRSVSLTEAGERFYAAVRPLLKDLEAAVAEIGELAAEPRGVLRLHVSTAAEGFLAEPLLTDFLAAHPHVRLELAVSGAIPDIVATGYDAGVELGEVIDRDMIAVPVTGKMRLAVVGSPSYFARYRIPTHPHDLTEHVCINWHATPDAPPYRWEFTEDGRDFSVAVETRVLCNDGAVNLRLARAGLGLAMVYEEQVTEDVARGELVSVLEEFLPQFQGCYLYYPNRRRTSPALRALIDYMLGMKRRESLGADGTKRVGSPSP
jgi:DNA-binding transcriptional LysR family regulator